MIFSELSFIADSTDLSYNEESGILSGRINDVPIAVFDNQKQHRYDIICGAKFGDADTVADELSSLTGRLPKKTVLGMDNSRGQLVIYCRDYPLMQENLPLLTDFLTALTDLAAKRQLALSEPDLSVIPTLTSTAVIPKPKKQPKKSTKAKNSAGGKISPQAVKQTLKGVLGGIIGLAIGCSIFVVFILLSDLIGWLGGIIMSAAVISMYTVFSHKLKTADAIITALMTISGWLFSNGFAYLFRIFLSLKDKNQAVNLFSIIDNISYYATEYYEQTNLFSNNLTVSFVFVVAGAIGSYFFYYKYHQNDMY